MNVADATDNAFVSIAQEISSPYTEALLQLGSEDTLAHVLEDAGFQGVLTKRIRAQVVVQNPTIFWDSIRGLLGIADPTMPAIVAQLVPGTRLQVAVVFALGRKHDPSAEVEFDLMDGKSSIALARKQTRELGPTSISRVFKKEKNKVVYLDIRQPKSRLATIKGAINVVRDDLEKRLPELVPEAGTPIVAFCQDGSQSALAAGQLDAIGYSNVWTIQGGMDNWEYVGLRVIPA